MMEPNSDAPLIVSSTEDTADIEECLLFLCRHFDLPVSQAAVRSCLVGDAQDLALGQFVQAAERAGLAAAIGPHNLEHTIQSMLPLVVLLKDNKAVVLVEKLKDNSYAVFNPKLGPREVTIPLSDLLPLYTGFVIACRPITKGSALGGRPSETIDQHWFWGPLKRNKWIYGQVIMAAMLSNVLSLTTTIFIMVVYDRIIPNQATESLIALTIGVTLALVFDFIVKSLRSLFIDKAGERADLAMGMHLFNQILDISMAERRGSTGAMASMLREFESLREFFTSASLVAIVDFPFILLFIWVIHLVAGSLSLVPLFAVPIILVMGILMQPIMRRMAKDSVGQNQLKQSVVVETLSGLETIKTTRAAPIMRKRWQDAIQEHGKQSGKGRLISQLALNMTVFTQQASQVIIVVYGVFLMRENLVTQGALVAAVLLTSRCLAPLAQLAQTMTRIYHVRASYDALDRLMNRSTERTKGRSYISRSRLEGKIEFRNVSFRYPDQVSDALTDLSFVIQPGEKVAFVGRIGSGKSTIARILLGLYEPSNGIALVDDTDLRQIDPADLRSNISCVMQEICLFTGTVRQNIAIGGNRPTDQEILRAAQISGVHDFISQTPQGYDLLLSERGEGLSGGQKQSIAIARSLVGEAPVLLMDEPTSAMDGGTEAALIKRLKEHVANKTLIVVTHRTSLLDLVDRVIVIDNGKVTVDGPKTLLQRPAPIAAQSAANIQK
ncbi:MAG: type I secretion system permease/ATPase [Magnetococcus sp. DMHC-6]